MNVQKRLTDHIYAFIELKRLYEFQTHCLKNCAGKAIKNDLLYFQVLFTSIDGLILRICNFVKETYKLCDQIRSNKPREFSHTQIKRHLKTIKIEDDNWLFNISKENLEKTYAKRFPFVVSEARDFPAQKDFDNLKAELEKIIAPIKLHRDKVVAHKEKKAKPASTNDLKVALEYIQDLLGDLYFIHSFNSYSFDFGGIAADPIKSADEFCELILMYKYERKQILLKEKGVVV